MTGPKQPTLSDLVAKAAAEVDEQFKGAEHVTADQIDAACAAAARRWTAQASQSLGEGLAESIRGKVGSRPREPKKTTAA